MKKMTKKEFLDMKIGDVFRLDEGKNHLISQNITVCGQFNLASLGIELIPEKPSITAKNLGRFMAKFGEYPEVNYDNKRDFIPHIEITDPRWTTGNLEGGE